MDFDYSPRQKELMSQVGAFMDDHIIPAIPIYEQQAREGERWKVIPIVEELKAKAKRSGLWNMFMPPSSGASHVDDTFEFEGVQLTNLEYAPIAEMFGRVSFASEVFNCSAPD
ncbi:MAG: acyl-CoA dehydrogenase, partial [Caulobacteraceae bacterium]